MWLHGRLLGSDVGIGFLHPEQHDNAAAPGIAVSRNSVRYSPGKTNRNIVAISGPTMAPVWSMARWKPKMRPREDALANRASIASRGAPRMPLPVRSSARISSTCCHAVVSAMSGRAADEIA
jgi:hypothetical protein